MKYIGLLSSAASGKLGGIVASHNRGGSYFRHHVIPVQPRTPAQTLVRNQLQAFSAAFKSLTQAQIAGWNALALSVTLKSKLGTTYNPTGQQLFVSCNKHLASINITTLLTNAPTIPTIPGFTSFTVTATSSYGYTTAITATYLPALSSSFGIQLRATSVNSAGRTFVGKSQFRTLAGYNPASTLTTDLLTPFLNKFGPLPSSGMIAYALRYVDPVSGFAGTPIRATVAFQQTPVGSLYTLSAASLATSLSAGTPVQKLLTATLVAHGTFSGAISWSVTGMPTGVTATIGTNPDATLPVINLIASAASIIGTYTGALVGTFGSFVNSTPLTITVVA
jgi:hypothetical protein